MIFQSHIPSNPLSSYVDKIFYVEGNSKGAGLPKVCMSLVFNLADSFKLFSDTNFAQFTDYKKYWLAGFQLSPRYVESYGESKMIIIQFKTIGTLAFIKEPLNLFTNDYVHLDNINKQKAEETWERLQEAETLTEKFLITENFLYQCLLANRLTDVGLLKSFNTLLQNNSGASISSVCKQIGISRKHLNHLTKEYIGVSPKTLSMLHRFQTTLQKLSRAKSDNLTSLAYEMDYYDQSHFSNEFKRLSGLKPSEYLKLKEKVPSLEIFPHFLPSLS